MQGALRIADEIRKIIQQRQAGLLSVYKTLISSDDDQPLEMGTTK